jgi:hypothetical protein
MYIILSVVGWAWCLLVALYLWVRLRKDARRRRDSTPAEGAEEVRA